MYIYIYRCIPDIRDDAQWPPDPQALPSSKTNPKKQKNSPVIAIKKTNNNNNNEEEEEEGEGDEESAHPIKKPKLNNNNNKPTPNSNNNNNNNNNNKNKNSNINTNNTNNNNNSNSNNKKGNPKTALSGMIFSITGTHSVVRKQLEEKIENAGGSFSKSISKYVISTFSLSFSSALSSK